MDFTTMDIATLTRSVTGGGVRYLELFLKEYNSLFGGSLNPSCPKCLNSYLTKYKNHFKTMQNTCAYRLYAKYENIPLQFGSPILVNNSNITNEYAAILLQQPNGERFFAEIPSADALFTNLPGLAEEPAISIKKQVPLQRPAEDDDDFTIEGPEGGDFS